MGHSRVVATVAGTLGLALAGVAGTASAAPTPAQPYVTLPTVLVTNVGQHFQLVGQYGNRGGRTLTNVTFGCSVLDTGLGSVSRVLRLVSSPFTAPFITGQNANFQFEGSALQMGSGGRVQCTVSGTEAGTGTVRTAVSNVTTIQVNR
jgi:hypothetical protein